LTTLQRLGKDQKQFRVIEVRDEQVAHLEQETQPVALPLQRLLELLRSLEVDGVVHGDSDMRCHLFHERHGVGGVRVGLLAAQAQDADSPMGCGQRQPAGHSRTVLTHEVERRPQWRFRLQRNDVVSCVSHADRAGPQSLSGSGTNGANGVSGGSSDERISSVETSFKMSIKWSGTTVWS
jgi:hypothetical protein